mmetsp:Transcript_12712/g.27439  ORF Transcript_12712/g.27439 Transcript_12712/m.27439 type:complete len:385 (-) Transcript_12712:360-1514(-)
MPLRAMAALTTAPPRAPARLPLPARMGVATNRGTTARSCSSSTPKEALPNLVASSFLSLINCSTNAELLRLSAPPTTTEAGALSPPRNFATIPNTAAVIVYWLNPSPNTSFFMLFSLSTLSSSPISKRKNTMPNSARVSVVCIPEITPKPFGPRSIPLARKPRMGEVPAILHKGVMSAVANRRKRVSLFGPAMYAFRSDRASRKVLRVWVDSSSTAATAFLSPLLEEAPPLNSSHRSTMVRSTGDMGVCCVEVLLTREMMESSMPDFLLAAVAAPPRATTDEADSAECENDGDGRPEVNKSACRPVLMKKRAENATARLANFFLNCSRFEALPFPSILREILFSVDFSLPRILFALPWSLLLTSALIDSRVRPRVVVNDGDDGR